MFPTAYCLLDKCHDIVDNKMCHQIMDKTFSQPRSLLQHGYKRSSSGFECGHHFGYLSRVSMILYLGISIPKSQLAMSLRMPRTTTVHDLMALKSVHDVVALNIYCILLTHRCLLRGKFRGKGAVGGMNQFLVVNSPETTPPGLGSNSVWLRPEACIRNWHDSFRGYQMESLGWRCS